MYRYFLYLSAAIVFIMIFFSQALSVSADEISAGSAVLIESATGDVISEKNAYEKRSMASTTKIMTTLLCLESGGLDDSFMVDPDAIMVEGSSMGLVKGDIVTKRYLCYGMLLPSGNDAANATAVKLAGSVEKFADMMNARAEKIGMENTHFVTPSGLEADGQHYSTAYDMALLAREALKNPDFREICGSSSATVKFGNPPYERTLKNTNKLLNMYDGVIGVKTGFTDEAGRCLVSACEKNGVTLICVTLNAPDDWNDHIKMYDYGFSRVECSYAGGADYIKINVAGSDKDCISAVPENEITYGSLKEKDYTISFRIKAAPFLYAPVNYGDIVGKAEYYCNGVLIGTVNLKAAENADMITAEKNKTFSEKISELIRSKNGRNQNS